jgi:hypothetical protein
MFVGESVVDDSKVILCETMQAMQVTFFSARIPLKLWFCVERSGFESTGCALAFKEALDEGGLKYRERTYDVDVHKGDRLNAALSGAGLPKANNVYLGAGTRP